MRTKTSHLPGLAIADETPLPRNRAPTGAAPARLTRIEGEKAVLPSENPFGADWALEDSIRGAGLEILDFQGACRTMDVLAEANLSAWDWHPLRERDRGLTGWRHSYATRGRTGHGSEHRGMVTNSRLADTAYPLPVPQEAWRIVARIDAGFPAARFFVTHYVQRDPDPFLAATCTGHELYVIAHWQRPGRREALTRRKRWGWL
jgi:hypothetical protein